MRTHLFTLLLFVFSATCFAQEKSLFSNQVNDFWGNLTIKKNDSSIIYKEIFSDNDISKNTYLLKDYSQINEQRVFLESEKSAIKHVMPVYKPKGNFKQKSIFPDNTMNHSLIIEPVKER